MLPLPPQNQEFRAVSKQEGKAGQQKTAPHVSQDTALCKADFFPRPMQISQRERQDQNTEELIDKVLSEYGLIRAYEERFRAVHRK